MSRKNDNKVFRIRRFEIGANVIAQIGLLFALLIMANYFGFKYYKRWDFSRDSKFALSEQTRKIVGNLTQPLKVIVLFSPGAPGAEVYRDLDDLLKEYQYAGRGKVSVESVDLYRNFSRARDLAAKYKFGAQENLVILDYGGRSKFVNGYDMADYDEGDPMLGGPPQVRAFKGEQAITSALLELVEEKTRRIAFTTGHGEPALEGGELSGLAQYIRRQNVRPEPLNLAGVDEISTEIGAVVIAGPRYDITEREEKTLRAYWERQGRLVIALDPASSTPRLNALVQELGVTLRGDRVLRTVAMGPVVGVLKDVQGEFLAGSPITKNLQGAAALILGGSQSLGLADPQAAAERGLTITPLIQAGEGFWGEVGYAFSEDIPIVFDKGKDHAAPLPLAAAVERGGLTDGTVKVNPSRLVVIGNGLFLRNEALTDVNVDFVLAGLNWLLDRQELIAIAPKAVQAFTLNLTGTQLRRLLLVVIGGMPATAALIGWAVWWSRRK